MSNNPPSDRFWSKVNKTDDGCWLWTASCDVGGYGGFKLLGKMRKSHIVAWEMLVGPKPEGCDLDHLCRVRNCVNPAHLEPVTHAENIRRGDTGKKSGAAKLAKTHCPKGHTYADAYVSSGHRVCRTCARDRSREQKRRAREKKGN